MKVVIRVDASLTIGTGHVMRCLTLADGLRENGVTVTFICREHNGNLIEYIEKKGFYCYRLAQSIEVFEPDELYHSSWLGCTQIKDARLCEPLIASIMPEWLVVDHYALDYRWHDALNPYYKKLMVIDDLADRKLSADLVLNQNYGADASNYRDLVHINCQLLIGLEFALLRQEFVQCRSESLRRRYVEPEPHTLIITLGGVDEMNVISSVLGIFDDVQLLTNWHIKIVVGKNYPHLETLRQQITNMSHRHIKLLVGISNMAEEMTESDLAIGAAGTTTWERCCLGLPSIQLALAFNQESVARKLDENNIVLMAKDVNEVKRNISYLNSDHLKDLSQRSARICDGFGLARVVKILTQ